MVHKVRDPKFKLFTILLMINYKKNFKYKNLYLKYIFNSINFNYNVLNYRY